MDFQAGVISSSFSVRSKFGVVIRPRDDAYCPYSDNGMLQAPAMKLVKCGVLKPIRSLLLQGISQGIKDCVSNRK